MALLVFAAPLMWSAAALLPAGAPSTLPPIAVAGEARTDAASYRGRKPRRDAIATLAWIPRVLLFPAYFFTDFVVREPLRGVAAWVDDDHVVPTVQRIFEPTPRFTWWPVVNVAAPYYFAAGVGGHARDVVVRGHDVQASIAAGAVDALHFQLTDSWRAGPIRAGAELAFFTRRDLGFYGLGPDSANTRAHFGETSGSATAFVEGRTPHVRVRFAEAYRDERTETGIAPSIENDFPLREAPGFGAEIPLAVTSFKLALDTRRQMDAATGARLVASGAYARDVRDRDLSFVRGDVDMQAAAEISHDRVISIGGHLADTAPLGSEPVPFVEMPTLGWHQHVGFSWGRFRDEAAVLVEARYRYPITYGLDMIWVASAGNVFARDFHDFSLGELTASFATGVRTRGIGRRPIELLFGLGTTRFDQDFGIQDFQVLFSTTDGIL